MSAFARYGDRLSRHIVLYAMTALATLASGVVSVVVLTRFLAPPLYGELALIVFFTALLSVIYNLGSLQGSFSFVFGSTGDTDAGDTESDAPEAVDRRKALGTGLVLTAAVSGAGTAVVAALAAPIADTLLPGAHAAPAIRVASVAAAIASVWRLASNTLRLERRPSTYLAVFTARPLLLVAVQLPLVAAGLGVTGAVAGLAIGNLLALAVALIAIRGSFRIAFAPAAAAAIMRRGLPFVGIVLAFWTIENADLFLLSRWVSHADVAVYQVAARVSAAMAYWVGAFTMASGPLRLDPLYAAVDRERGVRSANAVLTTYFTLATLWALLGLALFADTLVRIAPVSYAGAAPLIPLLALVFGLRGWLITIYRAAEFPAKREHYVATAIVSALVFIAAACALIPPFGAYGAAAAGSVAFGVGSLIFLRFSQVGPHPVPFQWGRIVVGIELAVLCFIAARSAGFISHSLLVPAAVVALAAYPALLVATRAVPSHHYMVLRELTRSLVLGQGRRGSIARAIAGLSGPDRDLLRALVRDRRSPAGVAADLGRSEDDVLRQLVAVLRRLVGDEHPGPATTDSEVGAYLVSVEPRAERDRVARGLWPQGVEPLELDKLNEICEAIRGSPRAVWRNGGAAAASDSGGAKTAIGERI